MIVPPPTDVKNARCQRSIFGIKRGHNHDQVDERKTKERRKKDVENRVNEGKKLCPVFGTLSHLWYIKNNTNRVLNRTQSRRRSPTIQWGSGGFVGFIRHDSCSDFRIGRRESSDGVFYIKNFPKNFFQNTVDKSPPLLYNGIVGRGQEPRDRRRKP